jgi:hypothetical protein
LNSQADARLNLIFFVGTQCFERGDYKKWVDHHQVGSDVPVSMLALNACFVKYVQTDACSIKNKNITFFIGFTDKENAGDK